MKILGPRAHGTIDYLLVLVFLAAPRILGFDSRLTTLAYGISALHLVLTLATDFPLGLVRAVPLPLHGLLEFAVALLLIALPWILGFSGKPTERLFFIGAGAAVLVVFLVTDYAGRTDSTRPAA